MSNFALLLIYLSAWTRFAVRRVDPETASGPWNLSSVILAGILSILRSVEIDEGSTLGLTHIIHEYSDPLRSQSEAHEQIFNSPLV